MDFIVLGFAVWRLTYMLGWEVGPGDIFLKFRRPFFGAGGFPNGFVGQVLSCLYCFSMYVALFLCSIMLVTGWARPSQFIPYWLGASGLAILIEEVRRKLAE